MKNFILSALLLSCLIADSNTTKAQPGLLSNKVFAKTTATKSRVIAEANYDFYTSYIIQDSSSLQWSGTMSQGRLATIVPIYTYDKAMINDYYTFKSDTIAGFTKTMRVYDANENLTNRYELRWNNGASAWDTFNAINYVYIGGKLIQDEMKQRVSGSTSGYLVTRSKNLYSYKAGLLDEKIAYTYISPFLSTLKLFSKTNYNYSSGVVSGIIEARWDSSDKVSPGFYNISRLLLTISGKDTLQKTLQSWDTSAKDWKNVERTSYNFSKGIYSEDLNEKWNKTTSKWDNYECDSLIYISGALTFHIAYSWDPVSKTWLPNNVNEFRYSGTNLDKQFILKWDGSKWTDNILVQYSYDVNNNLSRKSAFEWDGTAYSKPTRYYSLTNYYWEDYNTTSVKENTLITSKAKLYPNPAVNNHSYLDYFTAKNVATEVQVVDMMGRVVLHLTEAAYIGDHSVLLQLDNIASGVYIVNLISEGKPEAQLKLIKSLDHL